MKSNKETLIISLIGLIFLAGFFGFIAYKGPQVAGVAGATISDKNALVRDNSHMTGTTTAKVTMVEFGDYQCPACATVNPTLKQIIETYKENPDFNFVYRNFPLSQHKNAWISAETAEASGEQGKYWEMHDLLYERQNEWAEIGDPLSIFLDYGKQLGLDTAKLKDEIITKKYAEFIQSDLDDANKALVNHTPTVYINAVEETNLDFQNLKTKIDGLLAS